MQRAVWKPFLQRRIVKILLRAKDKQQPSLTTPWDANPMLTEGSILLVSSPLLYPFSPSVPPPLRYSLSNQICPTNGCTLIIIPHVSSYSVLPLLPNCPRHCQLDTSFPEGSLLPRSGTEISLPFQNLEHHFATSTKDTYQNSSSISLLPFPRPCPILPPHPPFLSAALDFGIPKQDGKGRQAISSTLLPFTAPWFAHLQQELSEK